VSGVDKIMSKTTALTCPHDRGPGVLCERCGDRPSPRWYRLLFRPFFFATGFWYHRRSGVWLSRQWDEIPEYVVRAGMLIYVLSILMLLPCAVGALTGWW
jgi:hypothetical protein